MTHGHTGGLMKLQTCFSLWYIILQQWICHRGRITELWSQSWTCNYGTGTFSPVTFNTWPNKTQKTGGWVQTSTTFTWTLGKTGLFWVILLKCLVTVLKKIVVTLCFMADKGVLGATHEREVTQILSFYFKYFIKIHNGIRQSGVTVNYIGTESSLFRCAVRLTDGFRCLFYHFLMF